MRYIVTLNNVKRSDLEELGFRTVDLGALREKRLNIPLTFIVNNQAFEDFLDENGLRLKIEKVFHNKKPADAYQEVLDLFSNAALPKDLENELLEAYESLTIDPGASASSIVSEWDLPFITLIRSPSYLLSTEDAEGIVQSIRGKEALAAELKNVWASFYSPESIDYRKKAGINDSFGTGVIVQKMKRISHSAVSYSVCSFDDKTIVVKSFKGLQDYNDEILGKDYHEVDVDTLLIKKAEVNVQEYALVRAPESEEMIKHELRDHGSMQKLDDKQISEIARITKRAKSFLSKDLKLYLGIRDYYTYVLLGSRLVAEPKKTIEEKEEIKLGTDKQGTHVVEHKHEVVGGEEKSIGIEMPEIISKEEVKKELAEEKAEEKKEPEEEKEEGVVSEQGYIEVEVVGDAEKEGVDDEGAFDEALARDLEFLDEIEDTEVKGRVEEKVMDKEVEKELTLLEEVLKIKDVVEIMEEHALNESKEAYEHEARKLRDMINRVREE